jgi:hypothetical protein
VRRSVVTALLVVVSVLAVPAAAVAAWISQGAGHGSANATYVVKAGTPTVTRSGSTAVISWPQGVLANGVVATGYIVKRTSGATTTTICTVAEPTHSCTDNNPVTGFSSYQVFSLYRSWTGAGSDAASFAFDLVAPVTTLSSNPAPNANGYNLTAPTITLTATDVGTGVSSITYKLGSAAPVTVSGSTASFLVPGSTDTTITYYATDQAGNVETTKTYTVKRDNTAPTTTLLSTPAPNANGYNLTAPTITLTAADAETSVASITYKVGAGAPVTVNQSSVSFTVSSLGDTQITYSATDAAGNNESTNTYTVRRDGTAPTTSVSASPAPNANGYFASAPTLTFTATDGETSVASVTYQVGALPAVTTPGSSASVVVAGAGTTVVTYYATDAAGNVESAKTYSVKRDTSAPTAAAVKDPTAGKDYKLGNNGANSWNRTCGSRSGICGTATDAESGISSMTYRLIKGTTCYNGTSFVATATAGSTCDVAMTYDSTNLDWFGGIDKSELSTGSYSVTVTATNGAGATRTSAAVAFTASN